MRRFRSWFGPSRAELWRKLSTDINGRYIDGGCWRGDKVEVDHGEWTVTLDTYTVSTGKSAMTFTRLRAPYVNPDSFRFRITRRNVFSDVAKWFGMQDLEAGYPEFDHAFIIKGTDEAKVRRLFRNARIRELLTAQPAVQYSVLDDEGWFGRRFPDGVDELQFVVAGVLTDAERLRALFDLFAETLDELCKMGSAYARAPEGPA